MFETVIVLVPEPSSEISQFTISSRPISTELFARFVADTGFITEFEAWDGDTWCSNDWIGHNHSKTSLAASPDLESMAAVHLTERDALEFCRWHGGVRLPRFDELLELFKASNDHDLMNRLGGAHEIINDGRSSEFGICCFPLLHSGRRSLNSLSHQVRDYAAALRDTVTEISLNGPTTSFRVVVTGGGE